jgi:hypothetical protein
MGERGAGSQRPSVANDSDERRKQRDYDSRDVSGWERDRDVYGDRDPCAEQQYGFIKSELSKGALSPAFASGVTGYSATVSNSV